MSRRTRRLLGVVLALSVAPALVVTTAAPSAAGPDKGAGSTRYAVDWSFDGAVDGDLTAAQSGLTLVDYTGSTYYDRVLGGHAGTDVLKVAGNTCSHGPKDANGVNLYGEHEDFARMASGSQGARAEISCVVNGVHYRYHWGNHQNADWTYDKTRTTNCLDLTRSGPTTFEISSSRCTTTQVEIRDAKGKQTTSTEGPPLHFTATLTVPGLQ